MNTLPCPDCGARMEAILIIGYGSAYECPVCHRQILTEDEDEE